MLSYTGRRNLFGKLTNNSSSNNLSFGDTLMDSKTRELLGKRSWPFLKRTATRSTSTANNYVLLPHNVRKVSNVTLTIGTTKYIVNEAPSREFFDRVTATSLTGDILEWFYIIDSRLYFDKTPSTAGNTITFTYKINYRDLTIADYTTGSIITATNGGTALVGDTTSWTAPMGGRWIRVTESNTANTGDGEWYEVESITNGTTAVLVKPYNGTTITAGSAGYTLGQMSPLPDGYHEWPVYEATSLYYAKTDQARSAYFKAEADRLFAQMVSEFGSATDNLVIDNGEDYNQINPNLTVQL